MSKVPDFDENKSYVQYILERYWDYGRDYIKTLPKKEESIILELLEELPESQINDFNAIPENSWNIEGANGPNLLQCACYSGHFEVAEKLLLYDNIDCDHIFDEYTLIMMLGRKKNFEGCNSDNIRNIVRDIVTKTSKINHIDYTCDYPETALSIAIESENIMIIELLLEHPDIEESISFMCKQSNYALPYKSYDILKIFANYYDNNLDKITKILPIEVISYHYIGAIRVILDAEPDDIDDIDNKYVQNSFYSKMLKRCIKNGYIESATTLMNIPNYKCTEEINIKYAVMMIESKLYEFIDDINENIYENIEDNPQSLKSDIIMETVKDILNKN